MELKNTIPSNGEFQTIGSCKMNVGIGKFHNGVTISKWYNHLNNSCFPIKTEKDLQTIISDYKYCKERAEEIRIKLFAEKKW